jgi:hypothetical protein
MIRPGAPEDAEAVARVQIESWQGAYGHLCSQEQLACISLGERTQNWWRWPPLVAEVDGDVVGFVAVGRAHDHDADGELWAIYVRARRFYEAADWTPDGARQQADLFGMSAPAIRYAKQL